MNLTVDLGNSYTKAALFKNDKIVEKLQTSDAQEVVAWAVKHKPAYAIVSSVNADPSSIRAGLDKIVQQSFILSPDLALPIQNLYKTPQTLGADRICVAVGASYLYPQKNCLIVDAGTCITYDVIDKNKQYYGGAISPGIRMKFKALHNFTARLPLVEAYHTEDLVGYDTKSSISVGVLQGTFAEVEGMIQHFEKVLPDLQVIICGGDTKFFESKIKGRIFVIPEMVLIGLNYILQYNVSKK